MVEIVDAADAPEAEAADVVAAAVAVMEAVGVGVVDVLAAVVGAADGIKTQARNLGCEPFENRERCGSLGSPKNYVG